MAESDLSENGLLNEEYIPDNGGNSELPTKGGEESSSKDRVPDALYRRKNAMNAIDADLMLKNAVVIHEKIPIN